MSPTRRHSGKRFHTACPEIGHPPCPSVISHLFATLSRLDRRQSSVLPFRKRTNPLNPTLVIGFSKKSLRDPLPGFLRGTQANALGRLVVVVSSRQGQPSNSSRVSMSAYGEPFMDQVDCRRVP